MRVRQQSKPCYFPTADAVGCLADPGIGRADRLTVTLPGALTIAFGGFLTIDLADYDTFARNLRS